MVYPGHPGGYQRMGQGTSEHVHGREKKADHPIISGIWQGGQR